MRNDFGNRRSLKKKKNGGERTLNKAITQFIERSDLKSYGGGIAKRGRQVDRHAISSDSTYTVIPVGRRKAVFWRCIYRYGVIRSFRLIVDEITAIPLISME